MSTTPPSFPTPRPYGAPPVGPPPLGSSAQVVTPPERRGLRPRVALGVAMIVVGFVVAAVLWVAAGSRADSAVRDLARAPAGCETTLDFAETGTFLVFVETAGSFDELPGDCDAGTTYQATPDVRTPRIAILDPSGDELDLDRRSGVSYDRAGYVGASVRSVEVVTAGQHLIRVDSDSDQIAVAVGRDPNGGVGVLRGAGTAAAILGIVLGALLLVLAARRRDDPPATVTGTGVSSSGWAHPAPLPPVAPPVGAPPMGRPPVGPPSVSPPTGPPVQPPGPSTAPPSTAPPSTAPPLVPPSGGPRPWPEPPTRRPSPHEAADDSGSGDRQGDDAAWRRPEAPPRVPLRDSPPTRPGRADSSDESAWAPPSD